ncbi:MAG TPA: lipocalin family protein [Flavilitoribacter sp.]|mgnify:CR=1 FL=1|nr:lipocalin family protein [Flavilitoribacter sp.]HMQ86777.1 lipocalin family protein [Flavilitoribacter sp.]
MKSAIRILLLICFCVPAGLYAQASLTGDWQMSVPTEDGGTMKIYVSFGAGNTYSVDLGGDGTVDITGKYELKDNQVSIKDNGGSEACTGTGVYKVESSEKTLKMTRVSDSCEGRGGPTGIMQFTRR